MPLNRIYGAHILIGAITMPDDSMKRLMESADDELSHITDIPQAKGIYDNYTLVNTHLINRCQQENYNSYLGLNSPSALVAHYLPLIFWQMHDLMRQNISKFKPSLEMVGKDQILIQKGVSKLLIRENGKYYLKSPVKQGFRLRPVINADEVLASHFITGSQYWSDRIGSKSLEEYDAFARQTFGIDHCPPSFFVHKTIVVGTIKTIIEEIRKHDLHHAFPYAILSREKDEYHCESLPLEPMMLFSSSYDAVHDYLTASGSGHIDHLVVFGDNQIVKHLSSIKLDQYRGMLGSYHLIGITPLQRDNDMLIWNWTPREERLLLGRYSPVFSYQKIPVSESFAEELKQFDSMINELGDEFGGVWIFRSILQCFSNILADKLNLETEFDSIYATLIANDFKTGLLSNYTTADEAKSLGDELTAFMRKVFTEKQNGLDYLDLAHLQFGDNLSLVVPRGLVNVWEKALADRLMDDAVVTSFSELMRQLNEGYHKPEYIFPYPITPRHYEILSRVSLRKPLKIHFYLYEPELARVRSVVRKFDTELRLNGGFKDARMYPETDFGEDNIVPREQTADLLSRLEDNLGIDDIAGSYEAVYEHDTQSFRILVRDSEQVQREIHCHSRIIRLESGTRQLVPVTELMQGDKVLYYSNRNCELLYGIITRESASFRNVESDSLLWKMRLCECIGYINSDEGFGSLIQANCQVYDEDALSTLANILDSRQQYMLDNWIRNKDRVKFPQKKILVSLLNYLEQRGLLSALEKKGILQSRALYNSVMISLGQNLSGEIQSILLNSIDETMDNYIKTSVTEHIEEYPILSRYETEVAKSIVMANVELFEFISVAQDSC